MVLGGIEYELESSPKPAQPASVALYTKASRAKMEVKEKTDLFERATAKRLQTKFTMMNLKLDDPDKLDDTYNLASAIDQMKENHLKYDLHDVFTILILDPTDPTNVIKQVDLYTDYGSVTADDVALSNRFYSTMIRDPSNAINENLKLTKTYLSNNTDDNLVLKINETYLSYPESDRGGPLFFKLLMDLLQNNSAEAAEYLVNVVKNLKITNFPGENILKVVSLIRGAVKRLTNLKDATGQSALPKDLADKLLDVFQTSSVEDFNSLFKHFRLQSQIATFRLKSSSTPSIDEILQFAENQYHLMSSTGKWTGVNAKLNETVFVAALQAAKNSGTKFTICFNCGGSHHVSKCPKPTDTTRIQANKKIFKANKAKRSGSGGSTNGSPPTTHTSNNTSGSQRGGGGNNKPFKWAPPTEDEKKNQNRRTIDGKLYYFHNNTKRWVPVNTNGTTSGPATTVANPAAANTIQASLQAGSITPVISNQTRDVAVANAARQIEMTFQGLLNQFTPPHT
jgi:hypothetical protein